MRAMLALSLFTPVLVAQAPAAATYSQRVAASAKAIETLKLENPLEALEKAKALLPPAKLAFDKTSLQTSFGSMRDWNAHIDVYKLIRDTGVAAGRFEEARAACEKGKELAKELQTEALGSFEAFKATWMKAADESRKVLSEIKELEAKVEANRAAKADPAKPKMSMEEANDELLRQAALGQRLAFLKSNEATYLQNIETASKVMAPLERPTKDLEARTREFDASIELWDKYLKEEVEDIASKYKGDKVKYAAGLLRGVAAKPERLEAALVALQRAAYLDPKNAAIQKRIDQLMGRAPAVAEKPAKGKAKKKGA